MGLLLLPSFPLGARPDNSLPLHQVTSILFEEVPLSSVLFTGDPHQGVASLLNVCCRRPLGSHLVLLPSSHPLPVPQYQNHWIHPSLNLLPIAPNFSLPPHISQSRTSHLTWGSNLLLTRTVGQMQRRSLMPTFVALPIGLENPRC